VPRAPREIEPLLTAGQVLRSRVEAWLTVPDQHRIPVRVVDLRGTVQADRIHRREAQVVVIGADDAPIPRLAVTRRGASIVARKVVTGPSGREFAAPLGVLRITAVTGEGPWELTGKSWEYVLARAGFLRPQVMPRMSAVSAIRQLVREVLPDVALSVAPGVRDVLCSARTYDPGDGSRWRAIEEYALLAGAELFCPPGGGFRLAPIPTAGRAADWTVHEGAGLVSREQSWSEDETANCVRVEDPDTHSVGVAADTRPGSPTYVGDAGMEVLTGRRGDTGLIGYRLIPEFLSLPASSDLIARDAARDRLGQLQARAGGVTFTAIDQPWADVGDVVGVHADAGMSRHVITGLPISGTAVDAVTPDTA